MNVVEVFFVLNGYSVLCNWRVPVHCIHTRIGPGEVLRRIRAKIQFQCRPKTTEVALWEAIHLIRYNSFILQLEQQGR